MEQTKLLYDKKTAADQLSISLRSLNYFISRGEIRFRRVGRRVLIPQSELVRFARGHHPEPVSGSASGVGLPSPNVQVL